VSAAHMRPVEAPDADTLPASGDRGETEQHRRTRCDCLARIGGERAEALRRTSEIITSVENVVVCPSMCGAAEGCVWPALTNHSREIVASARTAARSCGLRSRIFSDISITFALRPAHSGSPSKSLLKPKSSKTSRHRLQPPPTKPHGGADSGR
jgi:hypothetical protein